MFCKNEAGERFEYEKFSRTNSLEKVKEIEFLNLQPLESDKLISRVDWEKMTGLKKIVFNNTILETYTFQVPLRTVEDVVQKGISSLSKQTMDSLLKQLPNVCNYSWDELNSPGLGKTDSTANIVWKEVTRSVKALRALYPKQLAKKIPDAANYDESEDFSASSKQSDEDEDEDDTSTLNSNSDQLEGKITSVRSFSGRPFHKNQGTPTNSGDEENDQLYQTNLGSRKLSQQSEHSDSYVADNSSDKSIVITRKDEKSNEEYDDLELDEKLSLSTFSTAYGDRDPVFHTDVDRVNSWADEDDIFSTYSQYPATDRRNEPQCILRGDDGASFAYSSVKQSNLLESIRTMTYEGTGHDDNLMDQDVDWRNLKGLESLTVKNASVVGNPGLEDIELKTLTSIELEGCVIDLAAIQGFNRSASTLEWITGRDCIAAGEEVSQINAIMSEVNSRATKPASQSAANLQGGQRMQRSNTNNFETYNEDEDGFSEDSLNLSRNRSNSSVHKQSRTHQNNQTSATSAINSAGQMGTDPLLSMSLRSGARSIPHQFSRQQSLNQSSDSLFSTSHIGREKSVDMTRRYKDRVTQPQPEFTVRNDSTPSRNFDKLVADISETVDLLNNKHGHGNYAAYVAATNQELSIRYEEGCNPSIPILDADADSVKVHRGWRRVDDQTPLEVKAEIVLKSLGIPPCPPDIDIKAKKGSRLAAEIDRVFREMQSDPELNRFHAEHSEIIVTKKR